MSPPPLPATLGAIACCLLAAVSRVRGKSLRLRVHDDAHLSFRLPATAWHPSTGVEEELDALGEWSLDRVQTAAGPAVELLIDLGGRTADVQTPDVLLSLRAAAAAQPDVSFRLELPAGLRDLQRARAGLDSSRPGR